MHEITAKALTLAHETLRCGVPHFRERRLIPIRTSAHLIVFDVAKISPLYTMLEVQPIDETSVDRHDNFSSGDISLPAELSTTENTTPTGTRRTRDSRSTKATAPGPSIAGAMRLNSLISTRWLASRPKPVK